MLAPSSHFLPSCGTALPLCSLPFLPLARRTTRALSPVRRLAATMQLLRGRRLSTMAGRGEPEREAARGARPAHMYTHAPLAMQRRQRRTWLWDGPGRPDAQRRAGHGYRGMMTRSTLPAGGAGGRKAPPSASKQARGRHTDRTPPQLSSMRTGLPRRTSRAPRGGREWRSTLRDGAAAGMDPGRPAARCVLRLARAAAPGWELPMSPRRDSRGTSTRADARRDAPLALHCRAAPEYPLCLPAAA